MAQAAPARPFRYQQVESERRMLEKWRPPGFIGPIEPPMWRMLRVLRELGIPLIRKRDRIINWDEVC